MEEHEDIRVQLPLHRSGLTVSGRNAVILGGGSTATEDDGNTVNGVGRG